MLKYNTGFKYLKIFPTIRNYYSFSIIFRLADIIKCVYWKIIFQKFKKLCSYSKMNKRIYKKKVCKINIIFLELFTFYSFYTKD